MTQVLKYPSAVPDALVFHETEATHAEGRKYDLAERTAAFGERVIQFARSLPQDSITKPLIAQIVRSGTSIGANYCEADDAISKKEFRQKISFCRKESRETKYWLRMIANAVPSSRDDARALWQEAKELHLIFCAIIRNSGTTTTT
jgi:four helix bundle protein